MASTSASRSTAGTIENDHASHVRFSDVHAFEKPNDVRALRLMDRAAQSVMDELGDVVLAFGESDEYRWVCFRARRRIEDLRGRAKLTDSFLIRRASQLYNRRRRCVARFTRCTRCGVDPAARSTRR